MAPGKTREAYIQKLNARKKGSKMIGWVMSIKSDSFMDFTLKTHKNLSKEC